MPRTFKEFLPEKDYAGRLALGLGLLILGQDMTLYEGALYSVLRWVFFTAALVNYGMILFLYQRQKQDKISAKYESEIKSSDTDGSEKQ